MAVEAIAPAKPVKSRLRGFWDNAWRYPISTVAGMVVMFIVLVAVTAPVIAPNDPLEPRYEEHRLRAQFRSSIGDGLPGEGYGKQDYPRHPSVPLCGGRFDPVWDRRRRRVGLGQRLSGRKIRPCQPARRRSHAVVSRRSFRIVACDSPWRRGMDRHTGHCSHKGLVRYAHNPGPGDGREGDGLRRRSPSRGGHPSSGSWQFISGPSASPHL